MLAYLIIGTELIILYFVYWVVFIREPKPREIRAELWGRYPGTLREEMKSVPQTEVPLFAKPKKLTAFLPSRFKARLYRMTRTRKRENHHFKHETYAKANKWRVQSTVPDISQETNRQLAEKLLVLLNKTLNKFSVKIPH